MPSASRVWVVNDHLTTIPGSRTLWHDLLEWFDAEFTGGDYSILSQSVAERYRCSNPKPDVIIRNGSYFPSLDLPVPQIALFQDILSGPGKEMQLKVIRYCTTPIFNSDWTLTQFPWPDILEKWSKVIPLPIDFDLFKPLPDREGLRKKWGILPNSVCWIGARSHVKGWDILMKLVAVTDFNWCLVVKDELPGWIGPGKSTKVRLFSRLPQEHLVEVINACSVGLCTSRVETQHLAGLEMGACGLPLVTTNVGAYYGRVSGRWGIGVDIWNESQQVDVIAKHLSSRLLTLSAASWDGPRKETRNYWLAQGFDRASCEKAWRAVVEETTQ